VEQVEGVERAEAVQSSAEPERHVGEVVVSDREADRPGEGLHVLGSEIFHASPRKP